MKRSKFIRLLVDAGCYLKRHGSRHDVYFNPKTGKQSPIPRHPEIDEIMCLIIKKQLGVKED